MQRCTVPALRGPKRRAEAMALFSGFSVAVPKIEPRSALSNHVSLIGCATLWLPALPSG